MSKSTCLAFSCLSVTSALWLDIKIKFLEIAHDVFPLIVTGMDMEEAKSKLIYPKIPQHQDIMKRSLR